MLLELFYAYLGQCISEYLFIAKDKFDNVDDSYKMTKVVDKQLNLSLSGKTSWVYVQTIHCMLYH